MEKSKTLELLGLSKLKYKPYDLKFYYTKHLHNSSKTVSKTLLMAKPQSFPLIYH